ncbi:hypothetical protein D9M68_389350 [compost metagenome]
MLVERDQTAERERVELVVNDRQRRAVAGEDAVRRDLVSLDVGHALGGELRLRLSQGTPLHQRLGLRQAIGNQQFVLVAQVLFMAVCRDHELGRDDVRALVDELVEGVLAIGAGFAPDDRAG